MEERNNLKLKRPLPPGRSLKQVENHYKAEKSLAAELKQADREKRKEIYPVMYDKLFQQVPDHPRLQRRKSKRLTLESNRSKFNLVKKFVDKNTVFVEIAAGDCKFAKEMAKHVNYVYGVDISDQTGEDEKFPDNFKLITYDGYNLAMEDESVDVVFSDQLIEHLHSEDTKYHFQLVNRILKQNGLYVFRTPHEFSGPHDVSKYFSDKAEGFHLKEWTYGELVSLLKEINYAKFWCLTGIKSIRFKVPVLYLIFFENFLDLFSEHFKKAAFRCCMPSICMAAKK